MISPSEFNTKLRRLWREHFVLQAEWARVKRIYFACKYDPNQPRVPVGNPGGGQWTNGATPGGRVNSRREVIRDLNKRQPWEAVDSTFRSDGSLAQQTVIMRNGSAIRSEFAAANALSNWDERHLVMTPDGALTVFENKGDVQTIKGASGQTLSVTAWSPNGAEPQPFLHQVYLPPSPPPGPVGPIVVGAAALYAWMSGQNTPDSTAVLAFRANAFTPGADAGSPAIWVGSLTKEQVDEACPRHAEVQSITNQAADLIDRGRYDTSQQYGTAVHSWIKTEINGPDTTPESPPRDQNFRAEVSFIKSVRENYGTEKSIRVDVYENPGTGTVCVYDIKTGLKPLTGPRMLEIASNIQYFYPGTRSIIVTEVRPRR